MKKRRNSLKEVQDIRSEQEINRQKGKTIEVEVRKRLFSRLDFYSPRIWKESEFA